MSHLPATPTLKALRETPTARIYAVGASAARVRAALELGRRLVSTMPHERPSITSPADAANLVMSEMSLLEQEVLRVILLDTRNRVQAIHTVYQGSLNTTMVRVCELFHEAIRANCASIIAVHNHPSGDNSASLEDIALTRELAQAGKLLGIAVLDHIIVGRGNYASLREKGLGFS